MKKIRILNSLWDTEPTIHRFGYILAATVLMIGLVGCSRGYDSQNDADDSGFVSVVQSTLRFQAPEGWQPETPQSSVRKAQYRLSGSAAQAPDAELAVFYFGESAGTIQANVSRWLGQFSSPDGSPVTDSQPQTRDINGLKTTIVQASGTYDGSVGPRKADPLPGHQMIGVIFETPQGPWFFKMTGPKATVEYWQETFFSFIESIEYR